MSNQMPQHKHTLRINDDGVYHGDVLVGELLDGEFIPNRFLMNQPVVVQNEVEAFVQKYRTNPTT